MLHRLHALQLCAYAAQIRVLLLTKINVKFHMYDPKLMIRLSLKFKNYAHEVLQLVENNHATWKLCKIEETALNK